MFDATQRTVASFMLLSYIMDIQKIFGIDWLSVEWKDLRKPLYSAIGARLYIQYKCRLSRTHKDIIPRSIERQAEIWRLYYRLDGDEQNFVARANEYENRECCM